ncbi:DUF763 domain-containing protein [candidate division WOR-3 bacterium]|uniref:DUF763 domain-containing protein n=1 Tax=candidate division WOR-3 bacterium TaxID=2052148 RepID=A0A9D5KAF0_UNCW3|nr:DUF763 domain-containing protein [candidate division WOR-3 bacterium]MBD3364221.1 DUF763 domain-containing protein [candidate division WOR-3 bacterium]
MANTRNTADLPLHGGRAPLWLFERMVKLARVITDYILTEFDPRELTKRLSDPFWFQSLGCVLGFDWHSSGLTTTTCGALKIALADTGPSAGIYAVGGKGNASRRIPDDLRSLASNTGFDPEDYIYSSRMTAKVDSAGLQDGYQVYHQFFCFIPSTGRWTVIDQGMNKETGWARRYHWNAETLPSFVRDPHAAIEGRKGLEVLNMVSNQSKGSQARSVEIAADIKHFQKEFTNLAHLNMPARHRINFSDLDSRRINRVFAKTFENPPSGFENLLALPGVGPAAIRALALVAQVIFGERPSYQDPVSFSFAHGGKDGTPYPVNRRTYDHTISYFARALKKTKLGQTEGNRALSRLSRWLEEVSLES